MSKHVESNGDWLYFDYKYIGEKVDEKIFEVCFFYNDKLSYFKIKKCIVVHIMEKIWI